MPLPGGPSDKAGNRYERLWSALILTDLFGARCERVRFEVPGPAGDGFEFRVTTTAGSLEWHQAKRQRAGRDWSVAALVSDGVVAPWWEKLRAGERCVFVSGTGARQLKELVERASDSASWEEFEAQFLTGDTREAFQRLRSAWRDPPMPDVYAALQLVDVHLIDEEQLRGRVLDRLAAWVSGNPQTALAVVEQLVDGSVHHELTTAEVWRRLEDHGLNRRDLAADTTVGHQVADTVQALLARSRRLLIGGRDLPRQETADAVERLGRGEWVLLAGGAGSGKSVVAAQVVDRARAEGWPVLALSADSATVAAATTAGTWGESLQLPDSPVTVLANLAQGRRGLLVLDQLDAVGSVSGQHQERLELIDQVLRQAASHPGMAVLLACRRFDLDNDRILRRVVEREGTTTVEVAPLAPDMVAAALGRAGVDADALPSQVASLLRVPLHLALYVYLVGTGVDPVGVNTLTDLYQLYCAEKRRACREQRAGVDEWQDVVDVLVQHMSASRELTAPLAVLSGLRHQQEVMTSAGVLSLEGRTRVRFLHETLFDYLSAELFVRERQTLAGLLTTDEQDLFRRAQVRQILSYERAADPTHYLADLEWLLTSPRVRQHLKVLAVDLLQVVPDPTAAEWALIRPIADDRTHLLHHRLWSSVRGNPAWFPLIDADGRWAAWLADPDVYLVNEAVWALSGMAAAWPNRIVDLVRDLAGTTGGRGFTRMFLQLAEIHRDRALVNLFVDAIRAGVLDGDGTTDIWHTTQQTAQTHPEWAVDILHALLLRMPQIPSSRTEGPDQFPVLQFQARGPWAAQRGYGGEDAIAVCARDAPAVFVDRLLPVALDLMTSYAYPVEGSGLPVDPVWGCRSLAEPLNLLDDLFCGLAEAVAALAAADPDVAAPVLDRLKATRVESAWVLLAYGFAGDPARLADTAARWLTEDPDALDLGDADADHSVTRRLISSLSPHCAPADHDRLVQAVLDYTPARERTYAALKRRGAAQLCLLNGFQQERLTVAAARRLAELRRKFGCDDVPPPTRVRASWVSPPISRERAARMSDAHWLRAITVHNDDNQDRPGHAWFEGGATEQAQLLEDLTKTQPERFARLLLRFPPGTAEPYVAAVLRGIAGAGLVGDLVLDVIRHALELVGREANRWVAWLVQSEAAAALPAAVLDILTDIGRTDPDPVDDSAWQHSTSDPETAGLNCTRGAVANAMAALLYHHPTRLARLLPVLEDLAADRTLQVRAMTARAITQIVFFDIDVAITLLGVCVDVPDDRLLSIPSVEATLGQVIQVGRHAEVAHVVTRMTASDLPATRRAGARLLTVASYHHPEQDRFVDDILTGDDDEARVGVVEVAAASARGRRRPDRSLVILTGAFDDSCEEVRPLCQPLVRHLSSADY